MAVNRNCISYWYPRLKKAGIPTPLTRLINSESFNLDIYSDSLRKLVEDVHTAAQEIGLPCFLRLGDRADTKNWVTSCFMASENYTLLYIKKTVESLYPLEKQMPPLVWAVRQIINGTPLFYSGSRPINREFRVFMRDGEIEHIQPYWTKSKIKTASDDNWEKLLHQSEIITEEEYSEINKLCLSVNKAVFGSWTIDIFDTYRNLTIWDAKQETRNSQTVNTNHRWYITDMSPTREEKRGKSIAPISFQNTRPSLIKRGFQ